MAGVSKCTGRGRPSSTGLLGSSPRTPAPRSRPGSEPPGKDRARGESGGAREAKHPPPAGHPRASGVCRSLGTARADAADVAQRPRSWPSIVRPALRFVTPTSPSRAGEQPEACADVGEERDHCPLIRGSKGAEAALGGAGGGSRSTCSSESGPGTARSAQRPQLDRSERGGVSVPEPQRMGR